MRLVVDASVLVGESLRVRGRRLIANPGLELSVAAEAWDETHHELLRRSELFVLRRRASVERAAEALDEALLILTTHVTVVSSAQYADRRDEALSRIPRDPRDAPSVALALTLDCGIWTADRDFLGCGVATWTTDVLMAHPEAGQGL